MIHELKNLKEEEIKGKKVIVRVDFNVPVGPPSLDSPNPNPSSNKEGPGVANSYRIDRAMPTIEFLKKNGAKILLLSHIETKGVDHPSLLPVFEYFKQKFPELAVTFLPSCFGDSSMSSIQEMKEGEIILFENIRQYAEEKENNEAFAKSLASLGDIYVNDAFAVCHRPHASVVGIPKFLPSYAGFLLADEIKNLNVTEDPKKISRPFLFVLGGAKFETKLPLIQKFLDIADDVFIGGALANDLIKAKGLKVGKSVVSGENLNLDGILKSPKLIFPIDVVCKNAETVTTKLVAEVEDDDAILDIGQTTLSYLTSYINQAKYILWNGPLGNFEIGFKEATVSLAEAIGASSAHSVVGGGDTLSAIQELNLLDKFTFVSTGGGAMLDYLLEGTLVGIQALDR